MPFSTGLLAQDTTYRLSVAVYWLNLFLLGAVLFVSLAYAERAGLLSADTTAEMRAAIGGGSSCTSACTRSRRSTSLINTYLAIGLLVALQLNAVIVAADMDTRPSLKLPRHGHGRRPLTHRPVGDEARPSGDAATSDVAQAPGPYPAAESGGPVMTAIAGRCQTPFGARDRFELVHRARRPGAVRGG